MPVYVCLRGDCANIALEEPDCFVVTDAQKRNWFCCATSLTEIPSIGDLMITDLTRVQLLARKHGLARQGSAQATIRAADAVELARLLIEDSLPPTEVSQDRMVAAGWVNASIHFGHEVSDATGHSWHIEKRTTAGSPSRRRVTALPRCGGASPPRPPKKARWRPPPREVCRQPSARCKIVRSLDCTSRTRQRRQRPRGGDACLHLGRQDAAEAALQKKAHGRSTRQGLLYRLRRPCRSPGLSRIMAFYAVARFFPHVSQAGQGEAAEGEQGEGGRLGDGGRPGRGGGGADLEVVDLEKGRIRRNLDRVERDALEAVEVARIRQIWKETQFGRGRERLHGYAA